MSVTPPSCVTIADPPTRLSLTLPGGLVISAIPPLEGGVQSPIGSVQSLMTQAGPALAAIQPALISIQAMVSMFEVISGIPELIAGDVANWLIKLQEAAEAVGRAASLLPQISLPKAVADLIALLTATLEALLQQAEVIEALETSANATIASAQAAGNIELEAVGTCNLAQAIQLAKHLGGALGPAGDLLSMATSLLDFVPGAPSLPSLSDMSDSSLSEVVTTIETTLTVLRAINIPGAG